MPGGGLRPKIPLSGAGAGPRLGLKEGPGTCAPGSGTGQGAGVAFRSDTMVRPQEDLQKAHKRRQSRESFLETLESIIVAFVLAFVFRAFVVEAFVIPTGSMGPTLYGQHVEFTCSDCGYKFAMGAEGTPSAEPVCPNCFLPQRVPPRVPLYSGDRILVLKFLYDFEEPRRWDVIVFRNPNEPSQNYIKRLVGLPGETLEIVRGDVTIDGRIAHKADHAQDALWMLVHDTRYKPTRRDWEPRWAADKGWEARDGGFALAAAPAGGEVSWLTYRHLDPRGQAGNIMDFYAYNSGAGGPRFGQNVCTDLALTTEVTAQAPSSAVAVELRAYKDRIRFELSAQGSERPTRILVNGAEVAKAPAGVLPVGRPVKVLAANVDHKLMLLVGGRRVATVHSREVTPEGDITYEPQPVSENERQQFESPRPDDPRAMAAEARVGACGGPVALGYVRLDRDVYYVSNEVGGRGENGANLGHGTEGNPFTLKAGEHFVCGDNSPKSFDSRLWTAIDRPVVPRRNLVGKAFFVYWPAAGTRYHVPLAPDATGWRLVH